MSRKNVLLPVAVATNQSLATNFTTPPTVVSYMDNIGYQINVTTVDSEGTFKVQASMDYEAGVNGAGPAVAGTWTDLTLSGTPTVSAASDSIMISLNQVPYKALRLAYVSTTPGTGTCTASIMAKMVGA